MSIARALPVIIGSTRFLNLFWSLIGVFLDLAGDAPSLIRVSLRSRAALIAENLFLRKQLAFYQERELRSRRLTNVARLWLVFWSRFFDWRSALLVIKPATLIGWHRKAFRLFWRWKSRPGRRRIPRELRRLIVQMVRENPTWGEERIAHELWLKLGIRVSPRTVRAYWPARESFVRPALTALEYIRPQPRPSPRSVRFHGRGYCSLPRHLHLRGDGDRFPQNPSLQRNAAPNCRMDDSTATRSHTKRSRVSLPHS